MTIVDSYIAIIRLADRTSTMPVYWFNLKDGAGGIEDNVGAALPDADCAFRYACDVARELMKGREKDTRFWRLEVYENDENRVFELPFASIDSSLEHLNSTYRTLVEDACDRQHSFRSALHAARITVQESRALVARSRGRPYLASQFGRKIIRD